MEVGVSAITVFESSNLMFFAMLTASRATYPSILISFRSPPKYRA